MAVSAAAPALTAGCPIGLFPELTWRQEAANCKILVFGKLDNARQEGETNLTDVLVEHTFLTDSYLKKTKRVTIKRYLPIPDAKNPPTFLLFGDVDPKDGTPDYFKGVLVSSAVVEYLKGLLSLKDKPRAEQLRFCFAYLEHEDKEIRRNAGPIGRLGDTRRSMRFQSYPKFRRC